MIRLAVNAMPLRSPLTGIGQYTLNLFRALVESGEIDAHFFYGSHWASEIVPAHSAAIDTVKKAVKRFVPYPYAVTRLAQSVAFARGVWRHKPQVYHEPNYMLLPFRGRAVTTFHDLSALHMPELHPADRIGHWRRHLQGTLARADHFLTDSEFVRQELIHELKIEPARVTTAHIGVSHEFAPRTAAQTAPALQKHQLTHGQYLLAVGTLEPRKNLATALLAYAALPPALQAEYPFVVAGQEGWKNEALTATIANLKAHGHLRFLGFVDQADLPSLYAGARAFVFPSLYEGFGLPLAEAMASGVPTVTSTASCLPEIAGDGALQVGATDIDAMAQALSQVLDDAAVRGALLTSGVAQAARFTWQSCAQKTLNVYRNIV
jgi:glycosyltransferase involved in cell wall biosynthesis